MLHEAIILNTRYIHVCTYVYVYVLTASNTDKRQGKNGNTFKDESRSLVISPCMLNLR